MTWLLSILVAAWTGVIGLICAALVAAAYAYWYHVSTREGAAGFFVMGIAILGGMAALILGFVTSRFAGPAFWKGMACSTVLVLGIAGLAILVCYVLADIPPKLHGDELRFEAEIRLPAGQDKPTGDPTFTLGSVVNHVQRASRSGELKLGQARLENGRWILPAEAFLFTKRGLRSISIDLSGTNIAGFIVPLPGLPGESHEQWSDWEPRPPAGKPPWPNTRPSYRFRVQRIPPPPPAPTKEELQAREDAAKQAKFDAISPDAPIAAWIPYTQPGLSDKRASVAVQQLTGKPTLVPEMTALMLDADAEKAAWAMYLVERLAQPPAELIPAVTAAGRDVSARIRKFNDTPPEQDPSYQGAAEVSIRFSAWMSAVRTLREKAGGDFTPELREILELSRVRNDSIVMRGDVRRVASYYLKVWAGVEPVAGDPPPH